MYCRGEYTMVGYQLKSTLNYRDGHSVQETFYLLLIRRFWYDKNKHKEESLTDNSKLSSIADHCYLFGMRNVGEVSKVIITPACTHVRMYVYVSSYDLTRIVTSTRLYFST